MRALDDYGSDDGLDQARDEDRLTRRRRKLAKSCAAGLDPCGEDDCPRCGTVEPDEGEA